MLTNTLASIVLFGEKFSPSKAEQKIGILFTEKHEVGEIGSEGRFKGKPYPFGYAVIGTSAKVENPHQIEMLLETILPHMDMLRNMGVRYGKLQLTYGYSSQCNLE